MKSKKILNKLNKQQKQLHSATLKKLKKQQKNALKKLYKLCQKRQEKMLKKLKKQHSKKQALIRKKLQKMRLTATPQAATAPSFAHQYKVIQKIPPAVNCCSSQLAPDNHKKTSQSALIAMKKINAKPVHKLNNKRIKKIILSPLKSPPCRRCPAMRNGICKCALKKFT